MTAGAGSPGAPWQRPVWSAGSSDPPAPAASAVSVLCKQNRRHRYTKGNSLFLTTRLPGGRLWVQGGRKKTLLFLSPVWSSLNTAPRGAPTARLGDRRGDRGPAAPCCEEELTEAGVLGKRQKEMSGRCIWGPRQGAGSPRSVLQPSEFSFFLAKGRRVLETDMTGQTDGLIRRLRNPVHGQVQGAGAAWKGGYG